MSPPEAATATRAVNTADAIGMFVAVVATLSLASIVGAVLLPLAIVAGGGYFGLQWLQLSAEGAPETAQGSSGGGPDWVAQREKALEEKLHRKTADGGGFVMVVREGSDAEGSDYTTADAAAAVETLAAAFRGAFAAGRQSIRVDTTGRYLRCSNPDQRGEDQRAEVRTLLATIKAAVVAPGHIYPPIGPAKLQLTVDDGIYEMATRTVTHHRGPGGAAQEAPPLLEHGFPLHGHVPMLLAVDRKRLTALKEYYGERIAYYFEFVHFYNGVMVWPTVAGVVVHVYSWFVGERNMLVPLYAAFMMIWATLLTEFWKRQQAELAFDWNVKEQDVAEDRPQFRGVAQVDEVTGKRIYVDIGKALGLPIYLWRSALSYSVTLVLLAISATGVIWTLTISDWRDRLPDFAQPTAALIPEMVADQVPGVLQVIWLTVVGEVYTSVATRLNDFENHKTEDKYQDQLIIKRFSFEFVQWLFGLFYSAFWNQDREELSALLFGAMVTRQIVRQVRETLVPVAQEWRAERAEANKSDADKKKDKAAVAAAAAASGGDSEVTELQKTIEHEHALEEYSEFGDFLDMALQFAHLAMFSSAMPLAALYAWANNVLEMRTDFYKLSTSCQRPFPHAAVGIGSWLWTFEAISVAAVVTNVALIGWTTPWLDETMEGVFGYEEPLKPHHKLLVLVGIEHALLCVKGLVAALVPDVPERVATEMRRQQWLAEEAQRRQSVKAASGFTRSLNLSRRKRMAAADGGGGGGGGGGTPAVATVGAAPAASISVAT